MTDETEKVPTLDEAIMAALQQRVGPDHVVSDYVLCARTQNLSDPDGEDGDGYLRAWGSTPLHARLGLWQYGFARDDQYARE